MMRNQYWNFEPLSWFIKNYVTSKSDYKTVLVDFKMDNDIPLLATFCDIENLGAANIYLRLHRYEIFKNDKTLLWAINIYICNIIGLE